MNAVTPVQRDVYVVIKAFIVSVTGLDPSLVIQGLPNRSAMPPASPGFVVFLLQRSKRLRTNQTTWDTLADDPTQVAIEQGTQLDMQIDGFGARSGDWAVMLETLLRDETGCNALGPTCQPLYADEAFEMPLTDDEAQYEQRWSLTATLQYNPVTTAPMQFADTLSIDLINVDVTYPPA